MILLYRSVVTPRHSLLTVFIVATMLTHAHYISKRIVGVFCPLLNVCQLCATMFPRVVSGSEFYLHKDSFGGKPALKAKRTLTVEFSAEVK